MRAAFGVRWRWRSSDFPTGIDTGKRSRKPSSAPCPPQCSTTGGSDSGCGGEAAGIHWCMQRTGTAGRMTQS
jgi:hypothetical protein